MDKKSNYLWFLLMCLVWVLGSCMVEDSRAMVPNVFVENTAKQISRKITTAHYLTSEEAITEATAEVVEEEEALVQETVIDIPLEDVVEDVVEDVPLCDGYENEYTEPGLTYLGTYEITAYEWTGNPCANGNYPSEWYTVASNYFDFGTTLYIDGVGYVVVEDRGASWHSDYWLDLYLGDVGACYEWGRQYRDVWLVE